MGDAKKIRVEPISSRDAMNMVRSLHYSGKPVQNSQLHFGVFLGQQALGVMSFGPSLDKRKIISLVSGTPWNGFLELNRMAFSQALPRNSESRAIGIAIRTIKKKYPHIQWIVSFADGTQCGDGTIYRASGFALTAIKPSFNLCRLPDGTTIHKMTLESGPTTNRKELGGKSYYDVTLGKYNFRRYVAAAKGQILPGFQLRYIYFIDPTAKERLSVPVLPFSEIEKAGAKMYLGKRAGSIANDVPANHVGEGGATPTPALHLSEGVTTGE